MIATLPPAPVERQAASRLVAQWRNPALLLDLDGRLLVWNAALAALSGLSEDLAARKLPELAGPAEQRCQQLRASPHTAPAARQQRWLYLPQRQLECCVLIELSDLLDEDGRP